MEGISQHQPEEPESEAPVTATVAGEVEFTSDLDDEMSVIVAERVVAGAFRNWVVRAGLGQRRAETVASSTLEGPARELNARERELIVSQGQRAIEASYADLVDPEMFEK